MLKFADRDGREY